jgi:hypothetical protein
MRVIALLLVLVAAGCGSAAVLPSHASAPESTLRSQPMVMRRFATDALWVAGVTTVVAYDTARRTRLLEIDDIDTTLDGTRAYIEDEAVGSDGAFYALLLAYFTAPKNGVWGAYQLRVYPPGARGSAQPVRTISGDGVGLGFALGPDTIDVLVDESNAYGWNNFVRSYPYGAANEPAPLRTMQLSNVVLGVYDIAVDQGGQLYLMAQQGLFVYPSVTDGPAPPPIRSIQPPYGCCGDFALAPDGEVWFGKYLYNGDRYDPQIVSSAVEGFWPTSDRPSPATTIPFPGQIGGVAVDPTRNVYVAVGNQVRVYPEDSPGTFTAIDTPAPSGEDPAAYAIHRQLTVGPALTTATVCACPIAPQPYAKRR